jgi:large subunit ribosomal protein L30
MTSSGSGGERHLRVTQIRSGIGTKPKHRSTLRALGLRGVGRSSVLPDSASVRGMVARVSHLVAVSPAEAEERLARSERKSEARRRRPSVDAKDPSQAAQDGVR